VPVRRGRLCRGDRGVACFPGELVGPVAALESIASRAGARWLNRRCRRPANRPAMQFAHRASAAGKTKVIGRARGSVISRIFRLACGESVTSSREGTHWRRSTPGLSRRSGRRISARSQAPTAGSGHRGRRTFGYVPASSGNRSRNRCMMSALQKIRVDCSGRLLK
jgi:hypothetical protein